MAHRADQLSEFDGGVRFTDETRRHATSPQPGYHLFKHNGVWFATAPGYRSPEETPSRVGFADGPDGRRDAINELYGRTRFTSPLSHRGFVREGLEAA